MTVTPDVMTVLGDRYRLLERVATGGQGEVWRAQDTALDRQVAVKVLRAEYADSPEFRTRFRREAQHAAALSHPALAQVYDYGDGQGEEPPYLVMEFIDGEPLSAAIARSGTLGVDQTLDVLTRAAGGLAAAHAAGVVHRDIKPGNVLLAHDGAVKLTDFGIARAVDAVPLTRTGVVMGTPLYLSPEQAAGEAATPASDLYSLGVIGYEMLTGQPPFIGPATAVVLAHRDQPLPGLPDSVPEGVRSLIRTLTAKQAYQRPPGAAEVVEWCTALRSAGGAPVPNPFAMPVERPGTPSASVPDAFGAPTSAGVAGTPAAEHDPAGPSVGDVPVPGVPMDTGPSVLPPGAGVYPMMPQADASLESAQEPVPSPSPSSPSSPWEGPGAADKMTMDVRSAGVAWGVPPAEATVMEPFQASAGPASAPAAPRPWAPAQGAVAPPTAVQQTWSATPPAPPMSSAPPMAPAPQAMPMAPTSPQVPPAGGQAGWEQPNPTLAFRPPDPWESTRLDPSGGRPGGGSGGASAGARRPVWLLVVGGVVLAAVGAGVGWAVHNPATVVKTVAGPTVTQTKTVRPPKPRPTPWVEVSATRYIGDPGPGVVRALNRMGLNPVVRHEIVPGTAGTVFGLSRTGHVPVGATDVVFEVEAPPKPKPSKKAGPTPTKKG